MNNNNDTPETIIVENVKLYEGLKPCEKEDIKKMSALLLKDEVVLQTFRSGRDGLIITDRRLVILSVPGAMTKKEIIQSVPYAKVLTFSMETPGFLDVKNYLEFSLANKTLRFELVGKFDVVKLYKKLAELLLN